MLQVNFCLDEWSTGQLVQENFTAEIATAKMNIYRSLCADWEESGANVVLGIRRRLYKSSWYVIQCTTTGYNFLMVNHLQSQNRNYRGGCREQGPALHG